MRGAVFWSDGEQQARAAALASAVPCLWVRPLLGGSGVRAGTRKELAMKMRTVTLPQLALIGGTRAAAGAGLALLLADRLAPAQRRAVGWTLLAVGAISTIPLVAEVMFRNGRSEATARLEASSSGRRGTTEVLSEPP
jgi:hypothetical protein